MCRKYWVVALIFMFSAGECLAQGGRGGAGRGYRQPARQYPSFNQLLKSIPKSELGDQERDGLLLMREEEKLAHDVYVTLAKKWQLRPFQNIPRSEAMHMEGVRLLLDRYEIDDPIKTSLPGEFVTPQFQQLYEQLVAQGEGSREEAIKVGLLIEELDIADLNWLMEQVDSDDIRVIYQNLLKGSRNHLRVFWHQLERSNMDYLPQHLSQSEFDKIKLSEHERGTFITDPYYKF